MTDLQLYSELSSLPTNLKEQVRDFIAFLKTKTGRPQQKKQRVFGAAKGFFQMNNDFDAPLDDSNSPNL